MAKPAELPHEPLAEFKAALKRIQEFAIERQEKLSDLPTISTEDELRKGLEELPRSLPSEGNEYGLKRSINFLFDSILPTLAQGQAGPRYFGFVTGGTLPSALLADMMTTLMDANVQVHLPKETLSTIIEKFALDMILDVLHMDRSQWTGTFTTGATASNTLALACGRQATLQRAYKTRRQRRRDAGESLPEEEDE
jgi:glutamate/tyrosine decarboxylase-like PLP-dependent enzyme